MKLSIPIILSILSIVNAIPLTNRDTNDKEKKTILLSNDDGWAALNIRAAYRELTNAGYQVILSAPASQRSGWSGRFVIPNSKTLSEDGEFSYVKKGDPSWGHESDNNTNIWYFDGTPASSVAFGLNYVIPKYFNDTKVDLVVNGPNEGTNLSNGMYTVSGTIGATYNSVYRGIPSVAFSGSNGNNSFFGDFVGQENDDKLAANILANKVVEFVNTLFKNSSSSESLLPITTGINVNFPNVGYDDESCTDPKWVFTRLSGSDSSTSNLKYDEDSGLFKSANGDFDALTKCVFGDCNLKSEASVLANNNCESTVSVFSIDYDASQNQSSQVKSSLSGLF